MHKYMKKFLSDYTEINEYYNFLVDKTKRLEFVGITNEWLIDNYYLIIEHKNNILEQKGQLSKDLKKSSNIYSIIKKLVENSEYQLNYKMIIKELNRYQKKMNTFFLYEEISLIPILLIFIYISKLNEISQESYLELRAKNEIETIIQEIPEDISVDISFFEKHGVNFKNNSNYIFEMNHQLKELGAKANKFFKELNILLEDRGISLKEVLNDEYQRRSNMNLLISNIFKSLKNLSDLNTEDLYEGISKCEKYLMEDDIYNDMSKQTKQLYRSQIIKLSKRVGLNEIKYVERLIDNADHENYHIGLQLFKPKKKSTKILSLF